MCPARDRRPRGAHSTALSLMRARALCEASFKRPTYGFTLYQSLTLTFLYQRYHSPNNRLNRCCANVCTVPQGYRQGESRGGFTGQR